MKPITIIAVAFLFAGCDSNYESLTEPTTQPSIAPVQVDPPPIVQTQTVYGKPIVKKFTAKIVRIVDGDTIEGLTGDENPRTYVF